jgi:hypothetical protein
MVRIRISASNLTEPVSLDIDEGTTAEQVIHQALDRIRDDGKGLFGWKLAEGGQEDEKWRLRVNRSMEEGRWWTEAEVLAFKDRASPLCLPPKRHDI